MLACARARVLLPRLLRRMGIVQVRVCASAERTRTVLVALAASWRGPVSQKSRLLPGVHSAVRGRAVLPGLGCKRRSSSVSCMSGMGVRLRRFLGPTDIPIGSTRKENIPGCINKPEPRDWRAPKTRREKSKQQRSDSAHTYTHSTHPLPGRAALLGTALCYMYPGE